MLPLVICLALAVAQAKLSPLGWRAASARSPRITYRFQDMPLCEMGKLDSATSKSRGLLERWWNGGVPVPVDGIDLSGERGVTEICLERLKRRDIEELRRLIESNFWYSYLTPSGAEARVSLGAMNETKAMIYAHKTFHTFGTDLFNIVPSVLVPLKTDQELKITYNVIDHSREGKIPTTVIDKLIIYNSICTMLIVGIMYFVFRKEAFESSQSPVGCTYINLSEPKFEALTIGIGCGCQLLATSIIFPLIVLICRSDYSIYKLLIAFCIAYLANGFTVIRMFRVYRSGNNLFRTVLISLLLIPALSLLIIWHLNLLYTEIGSSRSIPILPILFKFLICTICICTPFHYAGAVLSYRFSVRNNSSGVTSKSLNSKTVLYSSMLLGLIPFGSIVLCISQFIESMFGLQSNIDVFISPSALILAILTYLIIVASVSVVGINLNLDDDWTNLPIGLAGGTSLSTFSWLTYLALTRYLTSAATLVEFITYSMNLCVVVGLGTLAVSYMSCEVYYNRFGGARFLTKTQF